MPNFPPFVGSLSTLVRHGTAPTSRSNLFVYLLRLDCAKEFLRHIDHLVSLIQLVTPLLPPMEEEWSTDFAGRSILFVLLFLSFSVFIVREGSAAPSVNRDEPVETFGNNS